MNRQKGERTYRFTVMFRIMQIRKICFFFLFGEGRVCTGKSVILLQKNWVIKSELSVDKRELTSKHYCFH